jgi:chemotaxis methyl-accepting protein methylase
MEDTTIDIIAHLVQKLSSLSFKEHRRAHFRQRIEERMTCLGITTLDAYRKLLESSPQEVTDLLETLTVNETYFFRNPGQFRYLMERVVPGLTGTTEFFDIIFCRNVMIYFSPECQQRLVDVLFSLLVPGGYLFTGDAEPLHLYSHAFETIHDAGCLVYRKMETTKNVAANSQ